MTTTQIPVNEVRPGDRLVLSLSHDVECTVDEISTAGLVAGSDTVHWLRFTFTDAPAVIKSLDRRECDMVEVVR